MPRTGREQERDAGCSDQRSADQGGMQVAKMHGIERAAEDGLHRFPANHAPSPAGQRDDVRQDGRHP